MSAFAASDLNRTLMMWTTLFGFAGSARAAGTVKAPAMARARMSRFMLGFSSLLSRACVARSLPARVSRLKNLCVVLQELFQTLVGQGVVEQPIQDLERHCTDV